mgnify:CR=1 FL=1
MHFTIDQFEEDFNLKPIDKKTETLELKNIQLDFDWENIIKDKINDIFFKIINRLFNFKIKKKIII